MMVTPSEFAVLLAKWRSGTLAADEQQKFADAVQSDVYKEYLLDTMDAHLKADEFQHLVSVLGKDEVLREMEKTLQVSRKPALLRRGWFRYAAAILMLIGAATIAMLVVADRQPKEIGTPLAKKTTAVDIAPGTNRAVLTVDNKQINLSSDKAGITVGDNTIAYADGEKLGDAGRMLTLTTPKGGQYHLVLPDGSKIWLNAASSITFPSRFQGGRRNVAVTGEAYLEIAPDATQAFVVKANSTAVKVLGTNFNINAYENEGQVKTTLVTGSIEVLNTSTTAVALPSVVLKPGQQAVVSENTIRAQTADLEKSLAWKNGLFNFDGADLKTVMRQLERWYDIKVQYNGVLSNVNIAFRGKMSRNENLSLVLDVLKEMGVKLKMEDKTIIVL